MRQPHSISLGIYGHRFFRFIVVGVLNTCIGLGVIYLLKWRLQLSDAIANAVGYAVGLVVSYQLNSRWTFDYRQRLLQALPRFAMLMLAAYLINLCTVIAGRDLLHINSYLAQALGVVPYTTVSYFGMRYLVFGRKTI